ncbi:MAG: hypothetical protein N4A53_14550 [Pelagimonas sp.]|nr:hypothetical protein [Pelagimonas sp.]
MITPLASETVQGSNSSQQFNHYRECEMRTPQPTGERGSLKWLQRAVNLSPQHLQPTRLPQITWLSPLADDDFAEYRDSAFLHRLELDHLENELNAFWPKRGPQWDALGLTNQGPVIVEAKAHVQEFLSPPSQAGRASLEKIQRAFEMVQSDLKISSPSDWARTFYQYANRLAHLWWLRDNGVDASLLFVSFIHDTDMKGPKDSETWEALFSAANHALGLTNCPALMKHVYHVTPDIRAL